MYTKTFKYIYQYNDVDTMSKSVRKSGGGVSRARNGPYTDGTSSSLVGVDEGRHRGVGDRTQRYVLHDVLLPAPTS